jgi:hypothetical protein
LQQHDTGGAEAADKVHAAVAAGALEKASDYNAGWKILANDPV